MTISPRDSNRDTRTRVIRASRPPNRTINSHSNHSSPNRGTWVARNNSSSAKMIFRFNL